jgi:hypothetical protein
LIDSVRLVRCSPVTSSVRVAFITLVLAAALATPGVARGRVVVPVTIDATGHRDVTAALQRFVSHVPEGSTVVLRRGGTYRIDGTLEWRDRTGITLNGNGATLIAGTHGGPNRAEIRLLGGNRWTVRALKIRGSYPGGRRFDPRFQWQHGIDLRGVNGALIDHVSITNVFGDAIYVGLSTTGSRWSKDVVISDSTGRRTGRMSVAVTAGRHVTIERGSWSAPALDTFDLEPNGLSGGARDILIEHTTIGAPGHGSTLSVAGYGPVSDVTLRDNELSGSPLTVRVDQAGLRPRNIVVVDNVSTVPLVGPGRAAMILHDTDGVTVRGNVQPLSSHRQVLVATENCTRVSVSGSHITLSPSGAWRRLGYVLGALVALPVVVVVLRRYRATQRQRV